MNSKSALIDAGYHTWGAAGLDPFEDLVGPFYMKKDADKGWVSAFISEPRHANMGGMLHGGLLMTFADFALFAIARDQMADGNGVTVSFNGDFVGAAPVGALIEATGEVTKATGSMVFVQGRIFTGDHMIMPFSGIIKKIKPR